MLAIHIDAVERDTIKKVLTSCSQNRKNQNADAHLPLEQRNLDIVHYCKSFFEEA